MGIVIEGIVSTGLGEGAFFMSMQHYKGEIKKKLGFEAYSGTLNIKVSEELIKSIKNLKPARINGYKSGKKTFGGASCYKSKINGINGAVIMPDLAKHKDIIEFIAPVHLRTKLNLRDGDKIKVEML